MADYKAAAVRLSRDAPDWQALRSGISGDVILPGDAGYDAARTVADLEFNAVRPRAVVVCERTADVVAAIEFARRYGLPPVPRSGGHSFAGYSTGPGMIIDVSRLNSVTVDGDVVHVQP